MQNQPSLMMNKSEFLQMLAAYGPLSIEFEKVNGELRKMNVLPYDQVPVDKFPKKEVLVENAEPSDIPKIETKKKKSLSDCVVSVYSMSDEGWRSFRIENLISVKPMTTLDDAMG